MPEIRAITYFADVFADDYETPFEDAAAFLSAATVALQQAGAVVQSKRMATQPFTQGLVPDGAQSVPWAAQSLAARCGALGIDYLSIGGVGMADDPAFIDTLPDVFASAPNVFACVHIADKATGMTLERLRQTAALIERVSRLREDGMANLFLAALANCPPFSPFFPVAYHGGGEPAFALAVQAADLANTAFASANTPHQAAQNLTHAINAYAAQIVPAAQELAAKHGVIFKGLDFSLAPYPIPEKSLGGALEKLGTPFGGNGLTASASLIMNAVEAADFPSVGFSGLMLPILEDNILGQRAAEGRLSITDLLLLSTVCGTGLDCVPLAGDVGIENLYAILLDVAALALRHDKPLTARLMPFPGKKPGDTLEFSFEYFAPSRVLPTPTYPIAPDAAFGAATGLWRVDSRKAQA